MAGREFVRNYLGVAIYRNTFGEFEYVDPSGLGYVSPTMARAMDMIANGRAFKADRGEV